MFTSLFGLNTPTKEPEHKEGDLYKVIAAHGVSFEIRYGYYEEIDRENIRPMEIYPNFLDKPVYTAEGIPFVTAMQKPCKHFKLKSKECDEGEDNTCYQCSYYEKCEELLGVCRCPKNKKPANP